MKKYVAVFIFGMVGGWAASGLGVQCANNNTSCSITWSGM
jgi:hypothetical protein